MSLRVYTVHTAPARAKRWEPLDPLPELVKEGFSWPAFFFALPWALYHRLWLTAAAMVALIAAMSVAVEELRLGQLSVSLICFAIAVLVGLLGNDWRRAALRRRGYGEGGVVTAPNIETGLRRYLDLQAIGASVAPRPAAQAQPWGVPDSGPWSGGQR